MEDQFEDAREDPSFEHEALDALVDLDSGYLSEAEGDRVRDDATSLSRAASLRDKEGEAIAPRTDGVPAGPHAAVEPKPAPVAAAADSVLLRRAFRHILLKDKLSFLLGCTLLWGCAFWLGRSPQTFYRLYTLIGLTLFAVRFVTYRRRRQHYYLYDFCYWANLLLLLQLWLWPDWPLLRQATFAFNTGPLTWSILAFRNSLVFHDLDKVTSLFLHLVPAFVSWSLRWYPEDGRMRGSSSSSSDGSSSDGSSSAGACPAFACFNPAPAAGMPHSSVGLFSLVVVPMTLYLAWAILYYLEIFVFSAKKIQQRGYQTLFKWVTTQKAGTFHSISKRVPPRLRPQVYLLLHLCFCLCTLFFAVPCYHRYTVHSLLLASVSTASIWAGASYYFEIFASRYHSSITQALEGGSHVQ